MNLHPYTHELLDAPFRVPDRIHQVGRALFLYNFLITQANARGMICRESSTLAQALEIPEAEVIDWSERLVACRLIEVLTPPPHFVIKLPLWSGGGSIESEKLAEKPLKRDLPKGDIEESLLKLSLQASSEAKQKATEEVSLSQNMGEEGVGEGGTDLRSEVRAVIGDHEGIPELLSRYPELIIRQALAKTRATPEDQIKKSRAALFWFLIGKKTH